MSFKVGDVVRRKPDYIGGGYAWAHGTDPVTVIEECDNVLVFDEVDLTWDSHCFELVKVGTPECRILKSNFEAALDMALEYLDRQNRGRSGMAVGLRDVLRASRRGERIVVRDE